MCAWSAASNIDCISGLIVAFGGTTIWYWVPFLAVCAEETTGLIHHSGHGSQYVSVVYNERLAQHEIAASTGTVGDSYDNALAENVNGSYKNELIHTRRWNDVVEVEIEFWEHHPPLAIIEIKASALEQNSGHFIMWCWWWIVITIGMVGCISLATI